MQEINARAKSNFQTSPSRSRTQARILCQLLRPALLPTQPWRHYNCTCTLDRHTFRGLFKGTCPETQQRGKIYIYIYTSISIYLSIYLYLYLSIYIYLFICIYICVCVCTYIYIYIERDRDLQEGQGVGERLPTPDGRRDAHVPRRAPRHLQSHR